MSHDKLTSRQKKAIFLSALLNWFPSTHEPPRLYLHIPSCNIASIILSLSGRYMSLVICLWLPSSFTCSLIPMLYLSSADSNAVLIGDMGQPSKRNTAALQVLSYLNLAPRSENLASGMLPCSRK